MKKYYVILCLSGPNKNLYLRAMSEGYTDKINVAGMWPDEQSAVAWMEGLSKDRYFTTFPVYKN